MKASQLRDLTAAEVLHEVEQLQQALFKLRLQKSIGQLEKPHKLAETRRNIARAKTILREMESAEKENR